MVQLLSIGKMMGPRGGKRKFTNKIRNPRGEGGVVGTVGVTNKCTNFNAKPTLATNLTPSANVTLSFPDWSAQLATLALTDKDIASFLANGVLSGKVVAAHNSDVVEKRVIIGGTTDNTNPHSGSIYMAVIGGSARVSNSVSGTTLGAMVTASATLTKFSVDGFTPSSSGTGLAVNMDPGATVYFILNDLTETATAAPVPTVVAGAAATGALPTYMAVEQSMSGVASSFLGTGTAPNGKPSFHIGIHGTLTGANALIVRMEALTYATASPGQAWGLDFDSFLSGGTSAGLASVKAVTRQIPSNPLAESTENGLSASPVRLLAKGVVSGASTSLYPRIVVDNLNNGAAVNAVLCIAAPKLVQLAVAGGAAGYMPAFPILPPVGVPGDSVGYI